MISHTGEAGGGGGSEGGEGGEGGLCGGEGDEGGDPGGSGDGGDDGGVGCGGADGGRNGGREGRGCENGSQQPVQSQPRISSSLHRSRPCRAPHVVARHPVSQFGGSGGGGACGGGGASWWMVTSVFVKEPSQAACHVVMPCGGEDKSLETWYAQASQIPSPSSCFSAVVLGLSPSKNQAAKPLLLPPQSGSQ